MSDPQLKVIEAILDCTNDPSSDTFTLTQFEPRENGFVVKLNSPFAKAIYDKVGDLGLDDGLIANTDYELEYEEPQDDG